VLLPPAVVAAVAAEAVPGTDPTGVLLTYGPLGVFAVLAVVAFRVMWKRYNELLSDAVKRAEAAEAKYDAVVSKLVDDVVPALVRSTDASAEVLAELRRR
jgi:hypothetical protein